MKINPLHDNIIVRVSPIQEVSAGGIFIPDSAAETPSQGEVLAVGPGLEDKYGNVRISGICPGAFVIFSKNAGQKIKIDGEDLLVLTSNQIIATVEPL